MCRGIGSTETPYCGSIITSWMLTIGNSQILRMGKVIHQRYHTEVDKHIECPQLSRTDIGILWMLRINVSYHIRGVTNMIRVTKTPH